MSLPDNLYNCIVVLGPTASGKTRLACALAAELGGEIISADSRQVYKHLNIGTGKDLNEYEVKGKKIPYHLIDICEPEKQFFLHDFMRECETAFNNIISGKKIPIICGGTGLYLDSLHKDFLFTQIPEDAAFRENAIVQSKEELLELLLKFPEELRTHTDLNSKKRIIRSIEIANYISQNSNSLNAPKKIYRPFYIGIDVSREERIALISERLTERLRQGLIEETEALLEKGISHDRLQFFGLEYKFLSLYLQNELSFDEMRSRLEIAIIQFSKRQMTWFRKMEKEGIKINWVEKNSGIDALMAELKKSFNSPD